MLPRPERLERMFSRHVGHAGVSGSGSGPVRMNYGAFVPEEWRFSHRDPLADAKRTFLISNTKSEFHALSPDGLAAIRSILPRQRGQIELPIQRDPALSRPERDFRFRRNQL